jgi:hypothetical protein
MGKQNENLDGAKRLMAALGRMPPKQHSDMKLGKPRAKSKKSPNEGRWVKTGIQIGAEKSRGPTKPKKA